MHRLFFQRGSASIAVVAILSGAVARSAQAQAPSSVAPTLCVPGAPPAPGCQPAPAGQAPVMTSRDEAAYRAQDEANVFAEVAPDADRRARERLGYARRERFRFLAEQNRPPSIPVSFPILEATAGFRVGTVVHSQRGDLVYGHAGPEVGLAYRFDGTFAVELPVSLMQTWAGDLGHWATVGLSPSLLLGRSLRGGNVWLRVGPDLLVPSGASGTAPNVMVGGQVGFGWVAYVASLPNYGYVGVGMDLRASVRGGVGGPESALDAPRFGADGLLVIRVGF